MTVDTKTNSFNHTTMITTAPMPGASTLMNSTSRAAAGHKAVKTPVDIWHAPAVIAPNNFVYKSLSNWAFNVAVGCSHACRFCYVPSAATIKQGPKLAEYGVKDPDAE